MMRKTVAVLRFISLASLGLFFNGLATYLVFNPKTDSLTITWLVIIFCGALGLNAWYCLLTGKKAWMARLGPLP